MVSLILQVQSALCHFMTQFSLGIKIPGKGSEVISGHVWGGNDRPLTEYKAAAAAEE